MAKIDPHRLANFCTALGLLTQLLEGASDTEHARQIARRLHVVADALMEWHEESTQSSNEG